ncbi:MAG: FtsW/RodA/SpoVE family cell cycle protein [Armatimonadota bacterium]
MDDGVRTKLGPIDETLLLVILALAIAGVILVYTASFPSAGRLSAMDGLGDPYLYLKSQLLYGAVGVLLMLGVTRVGPDFLRRCARPFFIVAVALLIAVFTPLGCELGGSRRWLVICGHSFQPSEFAKIALVIFLARFLTDKAGELRQFGLSFRTLGLAGVLALLVLMEPDLGTTAVLVAIALGMLFLAGARLWHIGALATGTGALAVLFALGRPYMRERLLAFLDPVAHTQDSGYHVIRMMVALASGGIWGVGIGEGTEKWFLPARHTDSIYCVLGEEVGLLGCVLLLVLFALFAKRAFDIALRTPDPFARLAAGGLTLAICIQVITNIAVATALLPVTGLTLPFISSGGSSLAMALLAAGVILSVSRRRAPRAQPAPDAGGTA